MAVRRDDVWVFGWGDVWVLAAVAVGVGWTTYGVGDVAYGLGRNGV